MKKTHSLISAFMSVALAFAVAGCQIDSDRHEHSFSKDWTSNATDHWHAATCGHTKEVSDKAAHTFGEWNTTVEATEETEGKKERSCNVCSYKEEQSLAKLNHTHKFSSDWTSDVTDHWHAATCEHDVTDSKAEHSFGEWTVTKEATCTENGERKTTCTICGYEKTELTDKAEHSFGVWKVVQEPTDTQAGRNERTCKYCAYVDSVVLQPVPDGFVLIPAGTFQMGSEKGYDDNKPVHEVTITKSFYMGKYEVTQAEYEKYCSYGGSSPSSDSGDGDNYPAYYVSWYDALVYCNKRSMAEGLTPCYSISGSTDPEKWGTVPTSSNNTWNAVVCNWNANGYRLPTEAEWEYAARAGDNTVDSLTYSGTSDVNKLGEYAWYSSNSNSKAHEVGTKKANGFGLYDMSGNVFEWCWNRFTNSYDAETAGGSDPTGVSSGSYRVFRGGCWGNDLGDCAVSCRYFDGPSYRDDDYGFRVVRSSSK